MKIFVVYEYKTKMNGWHIILKTIENKKAAKFDGTVPLSE